MSSFKEQKWPYHHDDEVVYDYAGEFVAGAVDARTAEFIAATPVLYEYFMATRNAIASMPEDARKVFNLMVSGPRDAVEEALEGLRI